MAAETRDPAIRYLHAILGLDGLGPPDAELLARFVGSGDAEAFEKLVRRHGPLVMGVCRRVLGAAHDADDAFQAAFLVFARKAAKIRKRESLASWLHGVAHFISRNLQTKLARQRRREENMRAKADPVRKSSDPAEAASLRELGALLDAEIQRLPANCRDALLVCHFEGQSAAAAAHQLGVPTSTLKSRLERGRELLRQRLERRGIAISAVALSVFLGEQSRVRATAALVDATVKAALNFAATGTASTQAAALAANALKSMALAKATTGFLAVALIGMMSVLGAAMALPQSPDPQPPKLDVPAVVEAAARADLYGDPLPDGAVARLGTTRWRHDRPVGFAAFRPDGKSVVTVGDDMIIRVWEYPSGKEIRRIDLPPAAHRRIAPEFGTKYFSAAALSPDGKTIATSMHWPEIRLHEVATAKELPGLKAATNVYALAFSANGQRLAALDATGTVLIWDCETRKLVKTFIGLGETNIFPRTMGFSPDGKALVTYDYADLRNNERLRLWNTESGLEIEAVDDGKNLGQGGGSLVFSPDSSMFAFVTRTGIAIANASSGKKIRTIPLPAEDGASCLVFGIDGKKIYGHTRRGNSLKEWDIANGELLRSLAYGRDSELDRYSVRYLRDSVTLSPDGKLLVLVGGANRPIFVDISSGKEVPLNSGHDNAIVSIQISPDGKRIITQDLSPKICLWDTANGKCLGAIAFTQNPDQIVISPDGKVGAAWTLEKQVAKLTFLNVTTGNEVGRPSLANRDEFSPMVFSGNGKILAVQSPKEPTIDLLDVPSGRLLHSLPTRTASGSRLFPGVQEMIVSPDGMSLATFADLKTVSVCDVVSGKRRGSLTVPPQGRAGKQKKSLPGDDYSPERVIQGGVFSPDGRCLAFHLANGTVVVYELSTGQSRRKYGEKLPPAANASERNFSSQSVGSRYTPQCSPRLAYSPDGKCLAYAGRDQVVYLWEIASGRELAAFRGHTAPLLTVAFAPNGKSVASAGWDTTALVWDVSKLQPLAASIKKLEPAELAANWELLASDDAAKGFDAIVALTLSPREAVSFIEQRLKPAAPFEPQRMARLIGQLDSGEFKVRDEAYNELLKIGEQAIPALEKALAANPPLETRRRLEALREKSLPTSMILKGERLRADRAVEVLERIGTAEARRLLTTYANGAQGALLTTAAEAALKR
jgi:RNA polymerase sigma factor (sigma-70 family)